MKEIEIARGNKNLQRLCPSRVFYLKIELAPCQCEHIIRYSPYNAILFLLSHHLRRNRELIREQKKTKRRGGGRGMFTSLISVLS